MPKKGQTIIRRWKFEHVKQEVLIPVVLVDADEYRKTNEFFKVDLDEFDIHEKSPNLTTLRRRVFRKLEDRLKLDWQPFLHVTVAGRAEFFPDSERAQNLNEAISIRLDIGADPVLLATTPSGQKVQKGHRKGVRGVGYRHDRREFIRASWPEVTRKHAKTTPHGYRFHDDEISALVPDTPANRAALNLLSKDLGRLGDRLFELFAHDRIQETLANASALLLTGHVEKETKK